jgi:hypothetical protein
MEALLLSTLQRGTSTARFTVEVDSQQAPVVKHPDDPGDHLKVLGGHIEPEIEGIDELGAYLLARVGGDVGVRLEEDLYCQLRGCLHDVIRG